MRNAIILAAISTWAASAAEPQATRPSPASGAALYRTYCASCHGASGKGGGPVAAALKQPPADLTVLARRNGGRFPAVDVFQSIEGNAAIPAHGSREMPVWGAAFRQMGASDEASVKLRMRNLVRYIESMQAK